MCEQTNTDHDHNNVSTSNILATRVEGYGDPLSGCNPQFEKPWSIEYYINKPRLYKVLLNEVVLKPFLINFSEDRKYRDWLVIGSGVQRGVQTVRQSRASTLGASKAPVFFKKCRSMTKKEVKKMSLPGHDAALGEEGHPRSEFS